MAELRATRDPDSPTVPLFSRPTPPSTDERLDKIDAALREARYQSAFIYDGRSELIDDVGDLIQHLDSAQKCLARIQRNM